MSRLRLSGLAILAMVALTPGLYAQTDEKTPAKSPDPADAEEAKEVFRAPMASATEPTSGLRFSGNTQIDFGLTLPFALYTDEGKSSTWQVGVQPGIMSRFDVNGRQWLLKSAEFWIGLPIAYRHGKWSARVEFYHLSSHRGGDFERQYSSPGFVYGREAIQALVAYDAPGNVRVYLGPTFVVHTVPDVGRTSFQFGSEWFPKVLQRRRFRFYVAGDLETREEADWKANFSLQPGIQITTPKGQSIMRLAAWFYTGQIPFGNFYNVR
jgi:hypothetical protein